MSKVDFLGPLSNDTPPDQTRIRASHLQDARVFKSPFSKTPLSNRPSVVLIFKFNHSLVNKRKGRSSINVCPVVVTRQYYPSGTICGVVYCEQAYGVQCLIEKNPTWDESFLSLVTSCHHQRFSVG